MRKKCLAIAKKAMVWALAASMLVATPLTASAAGLRDVYKVEDGWGNTVGEPDDDDTRTGTVTSTSTATGVLESDGKLTGIVLNETNVEMEMVGAYKPNEQSTEPLKVDFVWDDGADHSKEEEKLSRLLTWKSGDNSIVALNRENRQPGILNEMTLVAKAGGKTTVTVSLDDYDNNIHFTSVANVNVVQYATDLSFDSALQKEAFEGISLNLGDYLIKDPDTATDNIIYVLTDGSKYATLKNGVLKFKANSANETVKVVAIGEKTRSKETPIKVNPAVHATNVQIRKQRTADTLKKYDWLVNNENELNLEVVLDTKDKKGITADDEDRMTACTDTITWTSKKPAIVAVEGNGKGDQVKLVAKSVGTTTITALASGGRKATLSVTVRADLTSIKITTTTEKLYSGQSLKLTADQYFDTEAAKNFTDAGLTWSFAGTKEEITAMKKVAAINAKTGVVTVKPAVDDVKGGTKQIKIQAQNSKVIGKKTDKNLRNVDLYHKAKELNSDPILINLEQVNIVSITIRKNLSKNSDTVVAVKNDGSSVKTDPKDNKKESIAVDASRTYGIVATALVDGEEKDTLSDGTPVVNALSWTSSNEKTALATRNGNGSGTVTGIKKGSANISVSGATQKKGKYVAIKATFKETVTAPTKSIVLSTKNTGIVESKKQTVTIKATLDKGTTSKAKDIIWSAELFIKDEDGKFVSQGSDTIKSGKLPVPASVEAGSKYVVTAQLPSAGVKSSITLNVVKPSNKVFFVKSKDTTDVNQKITKDEMSVGGENYYYANVQLKNATGLVPSGDHDVAAVTYTMNKNDVVQRVGNRFIAIKAGTVKVTATTSDGKKGTMTITVK